MSKFVEQYVKDPLMLISIVCGIVCVAAGTIAMIIEYGTTLGYDGLVNKRNFMFCIMVASAFIMVGSAAFGIKQHRLVQANIEPDLPPAVLAGCFLVFGIALVLSHTGYTDCENDMKVGVVEEQLTYKETIEPVHRPGGIVSVLPKRKYLVFETNAKEEKRFEIRSDVFDDYEFLEEDNVYKVASYPITEILVDIEHQ